MNINFKHSLVSEADIKKGLEKLSPYLLQLQRMVKKRDWSTPECSLLLPDDDESLKQSRAAFRGKNMRKIKYVVVIGIGGSNLGVKAIYDAVFGAYDGMRPGRMPKCFFSDTTDAEWLEAFDHFLRQHVASIEELLLVAISKSGTTTETIANLDLILEAGTRRFSTLHSRLVVITQEGSKFMTLAKAENITTVGMSPCVGGRYSVLSSVGLVPLLALGMDVDALRAGATRSRQQCLMANLKNPALRTAVILATLKKKGIAIHDTFVFHPELESCGKWYRQLLGESIGKEKDIMGKTVQQGIFPSVSVGSTDLHSVGQLYLGGPQNIFTSFLWSENDESGNQIGYSRFSSLVPGINGKYSGDVMTAILEGVMTAYQKKQRPFMEVILQDIAPASLGAWMQYQMITMMLLANLFGINAFDQPEVELYKNETRKNLG